MAEERSPKVGKGAPLLMQNGLLTRIEAAQVPDCSIRKQPNSWIPRRFRGPIRLLFPESTLAERIGTVIVNLESSGRVSSVTKRR
jgi:hypothetical protein